MVRSRIPDEVIDERDVKHPAHHQCLSGCCQVQLDADEVLNYWETDAME